MQQPSNDPVDFAPRVLSGVQPSGSLHLGNYFGAIQQHIELQHEHPGDAFYFIADYHALTTVRDGELLRQQSLNVALDYLALGLDPKKATFYRQSDIPQVCELMWILSCVTGKGLLDRAHAYKDKESRGLLPNLGLFLYPELMASDILSVRATLVPVGEDQKQHLEMTRTIARSFNSAFATQALPIPSLRLSSAAIVPGVDGQKMSKSYDNTIRIFAEETELQAKVARIKTSSVRRGEPIDPDKDTVFALYRLVSGTAQQTEMRNRYLSGRISYRDAKAELLSNLWAFFAPFRARREALGTDLDFVEQVLQDGACRARREVSITMDMIRDGVGLGGFRRSQK